jgi:DNA invertase Pin-like site-specific DNA recombinase
VPSRDHDNQTAGEKRREMAALAELSGEWELIEEQRSKGANVWIYRSKLHPRGTGCAVIRMSTRDMKDGETAATQLNPITFEARRNNIPLGYLVVVTECSGGRAYWERPDLLAIEQLIARGKITIVFWRDVTRMARERQTFLDHTELLKKTRVRLYIVQWHHEIDWLNLSDTMGLALQVEYAIFERVQTMMRMQNGRWDQCILTGKGIGTRFGFRRNKDGWLEPDPETWPIVKLIHLGLKEVKRENGAGHAELQRLLTEAGHPLSVDQVAEVLGDGRASNGLRAFERLLKHCDIGRRFSALSNIIGDRIYVDGHFSNTFDGIDIIMEPVLLSDPIPYEVYVLNQEILEQSGGSSSRTRIGDFVLAPVLRCGICGGEMTKYQPRPAARPAYRHKVAAPGPCAGLVIYQNEIEPPVMQFLRSLDVNPQLARDCLDRALAEDSDERYWERKRQEKRDLEGQLVQLQMAYQPLISELVSKQMSIHRCDGDPREAMASLAAFDHENAVTEKIEEIEELTRRVDRFDELAAHERRRRPHIEPLRPELQKTLAEALTDGAPDDLEGRVLRAKTVKDCLSEIIVTAVTTDDGASVLRIELRGPLGAAEQRLSYPIAPSTAAAGTLFPIIETVRQSYDYRTVRMICQTQGRAALDTVSRPTPRRHREVEIPDWVSPPLEVRRTAVEPPAPPARPVGRSGRRDLPSLPIEEVLDLHWEKHGVIISSADLHRFAAAEGLRVRSRTADGRPWREIVETWRVRRAAEGSPVPPRPKRVPSIDYGPAADWNGTTRLKRHWTDKEIVDAIVNAWASLPDGTELTEELFWNLRELDLRLPAPTTMRSAGRPGFAFYRERARQVRENRGSL